MSTKLYGATSLHAASLRSPFTDLGTQLSEFVMFHWEDYFVKIRSEQTATRFVVTNLAESWLKVFKIIKNIFTNESP
jgi:hypothetical protein